MNDPHNPVATILSALRIAALSNEQRAKDVQQLPLARKAFERDADHARIVAAWIEEGRISIQRIDPPAVMQIPGGELIQTGGGCQAIWFQTKSGNHILMTQPDDGGHPPMVGDTAIDVGIYGKDEWEPKEMFESVPLPDVLSRLPQWMEK